MRELFQLEIAAASPQLRLLEVFAQRERDLVNEMEKRPFDVEIVFLATEPH